MALTATAAGSSSHEPAEATLRAPLLIEQVQRLASSGRQTWLDLGAAKSGLVSLLAAGPHRLVIADCDCGHGLDDATEMQPIELSVLNGTPSFQGLDLVLSWDLLNYLETDALTKLAGELSRHASPACALHALVRYSTPLMPDRPERFRLTDDATLVAPAGGPASRQAPRPSPKALEKAMPGWKVERTVLLNNGMQEFLFRKRESSEN